MVFLVWSGGVRKDYSKKDNILKKNLKVRRISTSYDDPIYDNKKYVSINDKDHEKWDKMLSYEYLKRGKETYDVGYMTTKDLRIAGKISVGKEYTKLLLNKKFKNQVLYDTDDTNKKSGERKTKDPSVNAARNIAFQTKTGKKIVENLLKKKYDGMYDSHGANTARNPLIIFNPDKNLKRTNFDTYMTSSLYKYYKDNGYTDKEIDNLINEEEFRRMTIK